MNCPSRTDNDPLLENPSWNQNPPSFAADLTTCQDLNGIANARELGDAECLKGGASGLRCWEMDDGGSLKEEGLGMWERGEGVEGNAPILETVPCTRTIAYFFAGSRKCQNNCEYRAGFLPRLSLGGWPAWIASVLCTSLFISWIQQYGVPALAACLKGSTSSDGSNDLGNSMPVIHTQPLSKRDACATGGSKHNYNLPFHVGGLFIILFVSSTACAFPILVTKFPRLRIPGSFLFSAKHFGTGVLIATAFVHLLPTAFLSLSNPCLSSFWTTDYPAMPGAIMLASIFFVTVVEMLFSPNQHVCGGNADGINAVSRGAEEQQPEQQTTATRTTNAREEMRRAYSDASMRMRDLGPLQGRMMSISRTLSRMREENERLDAIESSRSLSRSLSREAADRKNDTECAIEDSDQISPNDTPNANGNANASFQLTPAQAHKKAVMQCFLLEMGILFHSVFIGMALSVSVGSEFVILLIAIIFHQTFEGLALGVRIATITWPTRSPQPWLMALAYGCTTPLGQALGIATHTLYSPDSRIGLLVVGIMNAISAGFLVFASLVELMSEDFLSDESWVILRGKRRVAACALVFLGAFLMSLVGAWA